MATDEDLDAFFADREQRARERQQRRQERQRPQPRRRGELAHLLEAPGGRLLVGVVGTIAALTLIGLLALWPYGWHPHGEGPAATLPAHVEAVTDAPCTHTPVRQTCRTLVVRAEGRRTTMSLGPVGSAPAVGAGETVRVSKTPIPAGEQLPRGADRYAFVDVDRHGALLWMGIAIVALALALLRWRGLLAIGGVALSLFIVLSFLVPAILAGRPALLVALVASLAVMFITLVLTNGLGAQTLAAALGISVTLALACGLAEAAVTLASLDGKSDDLTLALGAQAGGVSLTGVVLAAMLVGALGVLADTAVTQASAVTALRRADPRMSVRRLHREALVVGRDHLSATIHTLVLAYTGAALPLLLILRQSGVGAGDALNAQSIAEPIVATAVGCIALIVAVPLTTGLAAALVARIPASTLDEASHGHGHVH
jgi:uncharacterized membrane protein